MKTKVLGIFYLMVLSIFSCSSELSIEDQMVEKPDDEEQNKNPGGGEELSYKEKAFATYEMIQQLYKKGDLYKENFPEQTGDREYSYLWPLSLIHI